MPDDATQSTPTMRLIFEYDGEDIKLISRQPVDVVVTGADISRTQNPGYYIDTRDATGATLARVPARDAFSPGAEVFPENPGEPISRVAATTPQGAFTVLVPVPENADHVSVVRLSEPAVPQEAFNISTSSATTPPPGSPEITEVAKFSIK